MIYSETEYEVVFYKNSITRRSQVREYLDLLDPKDRAKAVKYIEYLRQSNGYLDEPYSRHIRGKIRELRVDFWHNHHRIFYFTFVDKKIILLQAFLKTTEQTPISEIIKAENNFQDFIKNYEQSK